MSGRQISSRSYGGFGGSGRHANSSYVSSSAKYSSGNRLNSCVVCCHAIPGEHRRAIFAIGPCDHPICYHCAAKMRVLCEQNECPICRQAVSEVVFSEDSQKKFASFNLALFDCNSEYNIYFESKSCLDTFNSLLEERCKKCKAPAASIADLQEHLWEKHRMFTCGVCVQNLKIFSEERKYYNSSQLEHHMKSGDLDDRSYQGHPACQLCDQCYLDADELNRHLKREHYHCHLCDFEKTIYYNKYEVLNQHFRDKHFLCEEGDCKNEQFTSVFRTLIDLQAHKAEVHCLTKSEAKSARTLSLDFTFNPSSRGPRNGSYNPTVSASLNEGLNSRGMGRRGRGDRGGGGGGGNRGGPPTISEDVWMSEDLSNLGAAGPAQLRPEDFPSLDDTGRNNPPIGQENPLSVSFKPQTKANTNQELTSNDNQNSKAPKKPKHKFSTKVKESSSFGKKDDEEFPALCLSDSSGGRRTGFNRHVPQSNASSAKSISLADAVKLNSNPSEKTTSQPSDNNTKTSKSTKTSNNSNNNRISNDLTDPNDPTSDFFLLQNEFPSLPFKVNGNRKKKKALNILLASLSNPQPDPPSNYTSVRLGDSFSIPKENNGSTSNKNDSDNKPSLEEDMESLLLKEDNFPPLSGESKKKDTKIKSSSGPEKSSKASFKTSKQATSSSSSSSAATTTTTSVVRPPPGYEKRNLNKTKNTSSELTLEAVAQQVIKPITTAPSNSTINNHVNGKKSELSKKTDTINNVNQNELNNSNVSNNSKSNDKAGKKPTLSPSNQRKVKRENFEPSSIDPTNSKAAKQSSTNKSTINSRISPSSPTSFSQHLPTSTQSERPASSSNSSSNSRHHQNGTTNSSSNRPTSNYGEPSEYTYIYPDDFDDRNHQLFEKIQSILKDRFSDFDKISRAFINDEIPPHHYYNKCVDMFRNKLNSVLLELIVLLPDIRKQKHLMAAHDSAVKQRGGATPIKTGIWEIKTDSELDIVVCPMCGQVLSKKDGAHHIIKHQKIKS